MAIETLNIDGKELKVADLTPEIQRLVAVYDITSTKRVEVENDHIQLSAAIRQLSSDISTAVQKYFESQTAESEAPADTSAESAETVE
jgi:hypothetical protein